MQNSANPRNNLKTLPLLNGPLRFVSHGPISSSSRASSAAHRMRSSVVDLSRIHSTIPRGHGQGVGGAEGGGQWVRCRGGVQWCRGWSGAKCRVQSAECRVQSAECRVQSTPHANRGSAHLERRAPAQCTPSLGALYRSVASTSAPPHQRPAARPKAARYPLHHPLRHPLINPSPLPLYARVARWRAVRRRLARCRGRTHHNR